MTVNCTTGTPASVSVSRSSPASSSTPSIKSPPLFDRTDSSNSQDTGLTRSDSSASRSHGPGKSPPAGVRVGASPATSSSNRTTSSNNHHRLSSSSNSTPKVVYGAGTITRLPAELGKLGLCAPLIVSSPSRLSLARRVQALIPNSDTRILDSALVNVPQRVVEDAVARVTGRDSVISVGGSSAMRLAKAIALRKGIPHICIPTSYSGSESPLLGDVRRRKAKVRMGDSGSTTSKKSYSEDDTQTMPQIVIYDEDLTCTGTGMTISAPCEAKTPPGGRSSLNDDAQWSYIHLPGV